MRKALVLLIFLLAPALSSSYFGFRLDLSPSGDLWYKVFAERTVADFTLLNTTVRMTAGVELYNAEGNYLTLYTGYEVDLDSMWVQLRVQGDARVPELAPRFRISLLGGFSF